MRSRKLRWVIAVSLVVLIVVVGAIALRAPASRIRTENTSLIAEHMTLSQVEALLGGPPGDYRTMRPRIESNDSDVRQLQDYFRMAGEAFEVWRCDDASAAVFFDEKGGAYDYSYIPLEMPPCGALDNLVWRTKRQWHRWFPE